jgi:hypothetical protein
MKYEEYEVRVNMTPVWNVEKFFQWGLWGYTGQVWVRIKDGKSESTEQAFKDGSQILHDLVLDMI